MQIFFYQYIFESIFKKYKYLNKYKISTCIFAFNVIYFLALEIYFGIWRLRVNSFFIIIISIIYLFELTTRLSGWYSVEILLNVSLHRWDCPPELKSTHHKIPTDHSIINEVLFSMFVLFNVEISQVLWY